MKPLQHLNDLLNKAQQEKYPGIRPELLAPYKMKANSANSLTQAVKKYLQLMGHQCERISTTGRIIDQSREVTNVLGHHYKVGGTKWIPGTSTKGSADLSSIINGKSVKWEIKFGKDRQSDAQKAYQKEVEKAGGYYFLIHDFDQFFEIYNEHFAK